MCRYLQFILISVLMLPACEKITNTDPDPPAKAGGSASIDFPVSRLITDSKGRQIDVSITGRGQNFITFVKKSNNRPYEFLVKDLSDKDRLFVQDLPMSTLRSLDGAIPPYVSSREKEIEDLKRQYAEIERQLDLAQNDMRRASFRRDILSILPKIDELQKQIDRYWEQNPRN